MPYQPVTNFVDSGGGDLGKNLITKDYFLTVYPEILNSLGNSGLVVSPELWSWGYNYSGELGTNDRTFRSTPVKTILQSGNWKFVNTARSTISGIKTDGTLWIWGSNSSGQLGVNNTASRSTPVTTRLGGTNWKSIAGGYSHTVALKTDGTLWTWGANSNGQLGVNDDITRSTPVTTLLGGTNWKSIASGSTYVVALKTDGTLWSWGRNVYGQLGINDTTNRNTPVTTLLGGTNWKSIACGIDHTIALKTDGTLWSWGRNIYGQLGNNRQTSVTTVVITGTATAGDSIFYTSDTTGLDPFGSYNAIYTTPPAYPFDGPNFSYIQNLITNVSVEFNSFLGGFSSNYSGTLTFEQVSSPDRYTPVTTLLGGTNWKSIAGGYGHTVAIKTDGSLWSWGNNYAAELGINDTTPRSTPVTTLLGGTNWKSIAGGRMHTIAIKTDGTLWVWGGNTYGQLGINNTTSRNTPVTTFLGGTYWRSIASSPESRQVVAIQSVDYI